MLNSELFDDEYYGRSLSVGHLGERSELLRHYLDVGWRLGLDPHPGFSTNGYLADNFDVRSAQINPLEHFEAWGRAEGRSAVLVSDYGVRDPGGRISRRIEVFDLDFYRSQMPHEEFGSALEGLDHYLFIGWTLGADPHPRFSTNGYLHDNADVLEVGVDPLTHFVRFGLSEGREPVDPVAFASPDYQTPDSLWVAEIRSSLSQYLEHLGIACDVSRLSISDQELSVIEDPEWFDRDFYLRTYGDVAASETSPLLHFVYTGHREGRFPSAPVAKEVALRTDIERVLLARTVDEDRESFVDVEIVSTRSAEDVACDIRGHTLPESDCLVLSIAHDDYRKHIGGVQIVSAREEVAFVANGANYLSIFPSSGKLRLSSDDSAGASVRCRVNGALIDGAVEPLSLARALLSDFAGEKIVVVVHSILGHSPEIIESMLHELDPSRFYWWIHDYTAHCENYRLTRNGVNWCGDPDPASQSCMMCSYGPRRQQHLNRVRKLLSDFSWVFAAPSETAAEQSVAGNTPLSRRPMVIPHGAITRSGLMRNPVVSDQPVRLAFVGHPLTAKGWNRFTAFVSDIGAFAGDFEFFHFGVEDQSIPKVGFVEARPERGGRSTVTSLLLRHEIDAVMNFVDGRETFNFVTYETMAAGCCVITSSRSGNVFEAAAHENLLVEVTDETEAFDYLSIAREIRLKRRCDVGEFVVTGMTPALIEIDCHEC